MSHSKYKQKKLFIETFFSKVNARIHEILFFRNRMYTCIDIQYYQCIRHILFWYVIYAGYFALHHNLKIDTIEKWFALKKIVFSMRNFYTIKFFLLLEIYDD